MLASFPLSLAVGTVLGFLSGLGVGGGSLLLLWLTLVLNLEPTTARTINLWFFLPAALVACHYRRKQGTLELRKMVPAIAAGCVGAILGTKLGAALDTQLLKKAFGILLIATGIREVCWHTKKPNTT